MLLPLLGLLALLGRGNGQNWTSPTTYPSPQGYGAGNWSSAYDKARQMVANLTVEEMNNITYGYNDVATGCVGRSGSAPRVGFPGFCLHDAGNGVRNTDGVSGFPSGLHVGASWNMTMAYSRAAFMGAEFKRKGVNVALGPVVGPIGRIAEGGRNWEGFGSDPYLAGMLGSQSVRGLQQSVISCVKHFVANEQETNRNPSGSTKSTSANVDDQTLHELYVWPFQDVVQAGAASIMCSYNRINQTYACENSKTMNGVLKGEMNFQGFIVSDWTAQHSGLSSANAGLDMAMPTSAYWDQGQLSDAVNAGELNRTRLEDMATRIIAAWYQVGEDATSFPQAGIGLPRNLLSPHDYLDARDPDSRSELLQEAIEGHVLVKNIRNALPLEQPRVLSIFGYGASNQDVFNDQSLMVQGEAFNGFPQNWQIVNDNLTASNIDAIGSNGVLSNPPATAQGVLVVGGGSGSNTPPYVSSPFSEIQARAYENNTQIFYDFVSEDPNVVASSDACLVFINAYASEAWDRTAGLADDFSDQLVTNVASKCNNTIVVIYNAGARLVDPWIDNSNVTGVLFAHLPGQDAGRALVQILYGDVSPSGRLPYTVARSEDDYADLLGPCEDSGNNPQCKFSEGVDIDYRSFLARNVTPRFDFGYGLTYSAFEYSDLNVQINATATSNGSTSIAPVYTDGTTDQNSNLTSTVGSFGLLSLYESIGTITATIRNTGFTTAAEVAQLYLASPAATTRALRGFSKVSIDTGASATAVFNLRRKDVASWDTVRQAWVVPAGTFQIYIGKSVLDVQLNGTFSIE